MRKGETDGRTDIVKNRSATCEVLREDMVRGTGRGKKKN